MCVLYHLFPYRNVKNASTRSHLEETSKIELHIQRYESFGTQGDDDMGTSVWNASRSRYLSES